MCNCKAFRTEYEAGGVSVQAIHNARFEFTGAARRILPFCCEIAEHILIERNITRHSLLRKHADRLIKRQQTVVLKDDSIPESLPLREAQGTPRCTRELLISLVRKPDAYHIARCQAFAALRFFVIAGDVLFPKHAM